MGEEGRRGGAEIAQGLAYSGLKRKPSRSYKTRGNRRVLTKELSGDQASYAPAKIGEEAGIPRLRELTTEAPPLPGSQFESAHGLLLGR
jgi:hypothetical protein